MWFAISGLSCRRPGSMSSTIIPVTTRLYERGLRAQLYFLNRGKAKDSSSSRCFVASMRMFTSWLTVTAPIRQKRLAT